MKTFLLLAALALPAHAQAPTFIVQIQCRDGSPEALAIVANGPGAAVLTIQEIYAFCAAQRPARHQWQGGT